MITDFQISTAPYDTGKITLFSETVAVPAELSEFFCGKTEVQAVNVGNCGSFSVSKTFDCGQAFRFDPMNETTYAGIAFGRRVAFMQNTEGAFTVLNSDIAEFKSLWLSYLALDEDYDAIDDFIVNAMPNEDDRAVMASAVSAGRGIRILRQEPFETLISFIVSQNNNIPRIKKILCAMCDTYGEGGKFPTAGTLVEAGEDGLRELRTGFRAGYIYDAAKKVMSGEIDLDEICECNDYAYCDSKLRTIRGVGPKVSACVLLYGFHKTEAFPIDVWIKRSLERRFPNGFDITKLGKYAGIAQQYLFYYERYISS